MDERISEKVKKWRGEEEKKGKGKEMNRMEHYREEPKRTVEKSEIVKIWYEY